MILSSRFRMATGRGPVVSEIDKKRFFYKLEKPYEPKLASLLEGIRLV
jgi:hypothetical protein